VLLKPIVSEFPSMDALIHSVIFPCSSDAVSVILCSVVLNSKTIGVVSFLRSDVRLSALSNSSRLTLTVVDTSAVVKGLISTGKISSF